MTLQYNAPGPEYDNLDDEYVEFENAGNAPLDLDGRVVWEGDDSEYEFQDVTLGPGETIRLRTGIGSDTSSDLYWGLESPVWNNDGDTLEVRDETGAVVIDHQYGEATGSS